MKRYIIYIAGLLLLFAACSDEQYDMEDAEQGKTITVSLNLPDEVIVKTRAEDDGSDKERTLQSLTFITYNGDAHSETLSYPISGNEVITADGKSITLTLSKPATKIYAFANIDNIDKVTSKDIVIDGEITADKIPMSGSADISTSPCTIQLYRSIAKVSVQCAGDLSGTFPISEAYLYNTANKGNALFGNSTIYNPVEETTTATIYDGSRQYDTASPFTFYCYETKAGKARLIVEATYEGKSYFYPIDFNRNNTQLDLVRNHHYQVNITKVEGIGYASLDDAQSKDPINIIAEITDTNYTIKDMVVYGGHELGVCDVIKLDKDGKGTAQIFTTYPQTETMNYQWASGSITTEKNGTLTNPTPTSVTINGEKKQGYMYTWDIKVPSTSSTEIKKGEVTFSVGLLSLTVDVEQAGKALSDLETPMELWKNHGTTEEISSDYFKSLQWRTDKTDNLMHIFGTLPEDMQGTSRIGLHFNVGVNPFEYRIKKKDGDAIKTSSDKITIDSSGEYYHVIKCTNKDDKDLWEATVTITLGNEVVVYPVYHRGIIHEIKDTETTVNVTDYPRRNSNNQSTKLLYAQIVPASTGEARTGWFYYEMIPFGIESTDILYIYDRNVGAKTNGYYSDINGTTYGDADAVGAYYMRDIYYKGGKLEVSRGPSPRIDAQNWGVVPLTDAYTHTFSITENSILNNFKFSNQTAYLESNDGGRIYFPLCRYIQGATYEVTERKGNAVHRGNPQGISAGYYWSSVQGIENENFPYYQLSSKGSLFGSLRFSDDSGGDYDPTYRGMQVRCVFYQNKE